MGMGMVGAAIMRVRVSPSVLYPLLSSRSTSSEAEDASDDEADPTAGAVAVGAVGLLRGGTTAPRSLYTVGAVGSPPPGRLGEGAPEDITDDCCDTRPADAASAAVPTNSKVLMQDQRRQHRRRTSGRDFSPEAASRLCWCRGHGGA